MSGETLKNSLAKTQRDTAKVDKISGVWNRLQTLCDTEESTSSSGTEFNIDSKRRKVTEKSDNHVVHSNLISSDTGIIMDAKIEKNVCQNQNKGNIKRISSINLDTSESMESNERLRPNNTSHQNSSDDSPDLFLSAINKQRKYRTSVNKKSYKRQKNGDKLLRSSQIIDYESSDSEFDEKHVKRTSLATVENHQESKQQHPFINFKSIIVKLTKHLTRLFSQFQCRMNDFQKTYIQGEVIEQHDAKNIIFMLNCIISNLKEKLTEQQQDITKSYIHYGRKLNSSTARRKQTKYKRNSNLSSGNEIYSSDYGNECEDIPSVNIYQQVPLKVTKSPGQRVLHKNDNAMMQVSNKSDKNEELSKINEIPSANNKSGVKIRSIENVSQILGTFNDITQFQHIEKSTPKDDMESYTKLSDEEYLRVNPFALRPKNTQENQNNKSTDQLLDNDSDVNSTCSTVALFNITKNKSKNQIEKPNFMVINNSTDETISSEPNFVKPNSPSKNEAECLDSDSGDTTFIFDSATARTTQKKDTHERNAKKYAAIEKSDYKNSTAKHQFLVPKRSKVPSTNSEKRNHHTERNNSECSTAKKKKYESKNKNFNFDKKLQMSCNVTLEPLKIQLM